MSKVTGMWGHTTLPGVPTRLNPSATVGINMPGILGVNGVYGSTINAPVSEVETLATEAATRLGLTVGVKFQPWVGSRGGYRMSFEHTSVQDCVFGAEVSVDQASRAHDLKGLIEWHAREAYWGLLEREPPTYAQGKDILSFLGNTDGPLSQYFAPAGTSTIRVQSKCTTCGYDDCPQGRCGYCGTRQCLVISWMRLAVITVWL